MPVMGMSHKYPFEKMGKFFYRTFILGIPDVDDLAPTAVVPVLEDFHERRQYHHRHK